MPISILTALNGAYNSEVFVNGLQHAENQPVINMGISLAPNTYWPALAFHDNLVPLTATINSVSLRLTHNAPRSGGPFLSFNLWPLRFVDCPPFTDPFAFNGGEVNPANLNACAAGGTEVPPLPDWAFSFDMPNIVAAGTVTAIDGVDFGFALKEGYKQWKARAGMALGNNFGLYITHASGASAEYFIRAFNSASPPQLVIDWSPETTTPTVVSLVVINTTQMDITFSEPMGVGVLTTLNYSIAGIGQGTFALHPDLVTFQTGTTYRLKWTSGEMFNGGTILITVNNVQDANGNTISGLNVGAHTNGGIGNLPTVAISSPANGATVTSLPITVTGTAVDAIAPSSGINFVQVSANAGAFVNATGTSSWGTTLNAANGIVAGANTIRARSFDGAGNISNLSTIPITYSPDVSAPTITQVLVISATQIQVTFSETMGAGVLVAANYTISGLGKGTFAPNPDTVPVAQGSNAYLLTWSTGEMFIGGTITITVLNVQDAAGNPIVAGSNSGTHLNGGQGNPPTVAIVSPLNGASFLVAGITVSGTAADPGVPTSGLNLVEVNHVESGGGYSAATSLGNWTKDLTLIAGSNTIQVRSRDGAGNLSTVSTINVTFAPDTTGPTVLTVQVVNGRAVDVTFSEPMGAGVGTSGNYSISGTGKGTLSLKPNTVLVPSSGNTYRLYWTTGEMFDDGDITITVSTGVKDANGNNMGSQNSGTHAGGALGFRPGINITIPNDNITVNTPTYELSGFAVDPGPCISGISNVHLFVNSVDAGAATGTFPVWHKTVSLSLGANAIYGVTTNGAGNVSEPTPIITITLVDNTNPIVTITEVGPYYTNSPSIIVHGTVIDDIDTVSMTWANSAGGSGALSFTGGDGTLGSYFTTHITLVHNVLQTITIRAYDSSGNMGSASLLVSHYTGDITPIDPVAIATTVTITSPTSSPSYVTSTSPFSIAGTAVNNAEAIGTVTWENDQGGSGPCVFSAPNFSASGIVLQPNVVNKITIRGYSISLLIPGSDFINVTYTPVIFTGFKTVPLRPHWIVDAGFWLPAESGFDPTQHNIQLVMIYYVRSTKKLYFEFRSTAPLLQCYRWVFTHDMLLVLNAEFEPNYMTYFCNGLTGACYGLGGWIMPNEDHSTWPNADNVGRNAYSGTYVPTGTESINVAGFSFITVGNVSNYFKQIETLAASSQFPLDPNGNVALFPKRPIIVESSRIHIMSGRAVSIRLANEKPIRLPDPCVDSEAVQSYPGIATSTGGSLTGDVKFREGFNCDISLNAALNRISISGRIGAGAGPTCPPLGPYDSEDYLPYYYATTPDDPNDKFRCEDLIYTLDGSGPNSDGTLQLQGAEGTVINGDPLSNTIVVQAPTRTVCN